LQQAVSRRLCGNDAFAASTTAAVPYQAMAESPSDFGELSRAATARRKASASSGEPSTSRTWARVMPGLTSASCSLVTTLPCTTSTR
jgi:hypothetical protein